MSRAEELHDDPALLERLSALVDGELGGSEARFMVRRLATDADLRRRWERYHLIGEALRRSLPRRLDPALAARIEARLPELPAPAPGLVGRLRGRWLQAAAGLALAASVAAMAVLALRARAPEPAVPVVAQAPSPTTAGRPVWEGTQWASVRPVIAQRLNGYLVTHNELAAAGRLQGIMPYARVVSYDADAADARR